MQLHLIAILLWEFYPSMEIIEFQYYKLCISRSYYYDSNLLKTINLK